VIEGFRFRPAPTSRTTASASLSAMSNSITEQKKYCKAQPVENGHARCPPFAAAFASGVLTLLMCAISISGVASVKLVATASLPDRLFRRDRATRNSRRRESSFFHWNEQFRWQTCIWVEQFWGHKIGLFVIPTVVCEGRTVVPVEVLMQGPLHEKN
jgi:hypothetical protein